MTASNFEPPDIYDVDTVEKLRVIANPLRMRIIDCLIPQARTAKEVGELLRMQSNTRYYHISELEQAGMVKVVDTVIKSGIQQKYYRAAGKYFRLEPTLLHGDSPEPLKSAGAFFAAAIETAAADLRHTFSSGQVANLRPVTRVSRTTIKANPERMAEFRERLTALEREFNALEDTDAGESFEFAFAFFPFIHPDDYPTE